MLEKILIPILEYYINAPFEKVTKNTIIKERVRTIRSMQILIYSNDHNPPHFHVISKDGKINANFSIEDCIKLSGKITSKDEKRIKSFHNDLKTKTIMKNIWEKKSKTD